jgi:hypothetical protein
MPLTKISTLLDNVVEVVNPTVGSSSGSKAFIVSPVRGRLMEAGFIPHSTITSNTTFRVRIASFISSTASVLTEVVTSTLGTFNSVMLVEGQVASVIPPSPAYVNIGDAVEMTTSGGHSSLVAGTLYGVFQKG